MKYSVFFLEKEDKQLDKIDVTQQRIIINRIGKNLVGTDNPRIFGEAFKGKLKDCRRYRVGDYRIIAELD